MKEQTKEAPKNDTQKNDTPKKETQKNETVKSETQNGVSKKVEQTNVQHAYSQPSFGFGPFGMFNKPQTGQKPFTVSRQNDTVKVTIFDRSLANNLSQFVKNEEIYAVTPSLEIQTFLTVLPELKERNGYTKDKKQQGQINNPIFEFIEFLDSELEETMKKIENMVKNGEISYNYLWYVFKKGTKISTLDRHRKYYIGSVVQKTEYFKNWFTSEFVITGTTITSNGKQFLTGTRQFRIHHFSGTKKIEDLSVIPLAEDSALMKMLIQRGKKFKEIAIGPHYKCCKGTVLQRHWWFTTEYKADGRIMIDTASFIRMNPQYDLAYAGINKNHQPMFTYNNFNSGSQTTSSNTIDDENLFMCDSFVFGFSFVCKKWGEIGVDDITPIKFDDNAFDRLVLDPKKKALIKALVINSDKTYTDVISGKGGGCIFLLHGPPGVGKTLTAEAIAELLHRPLYSVSVGELGVETFTLEKKLREILDVASVWNAVILIDEADIFLERRTEKDIERNAMVGIFLRLLEYHQGVLFLTTNRVKCFDEAFHSRISVAIRYKDLDKNARKQVWKNFLDACGLEYKQLNLDKLSELELNGRQIKNTIRLAAALSVASGKEGTILEEHVNQCVNIAEQFQNFMQDQMNVE